MEMLVNIVVTLLWIPEAISWSLLETIDFTLLDETIYCQVVINSSDFDLSSLGIGNIYFPNNHECNPSLVLMPLSDLEKYSCQPDGNPFQAHF